MELITAEQLEAIHKLQGTALRQGNHAAYWALSLAIDFALDCRCNGEIEKDIVRIADAYNALPYNSSYRSGPQRLEEL